ncbi:4-hydroxythreonine-4-phosphate dehydrogenase PdxA [Altererythrobacter sp. MF3-039]|uniref:4-hydroxythreonine-4-phosphate dehydrogenase PdxA n=1 Tax=Altererythrobacter sp. MF3-039 TaxID=3252901 RepID=UPI00390C9EBD
MSQTSPRPLVLSLGDPAGIGPELICEAWAQREAEHLPPFFVIGGAEVLAQAARKRGLNVPIVRIDSPAEAYDAFAGALSVLGHADAKYAPGNPDRAGAELALASLESATGLAVLGEASAIVTGPIAKGLLATVGFEYPGQTEFLANACGESGDQAVMMLAGPNLRTVPLTVHCAIAEVSDRLSTKLIGSRCAIVASALKHDFGIENPRLAVAGLNPHAGEGGKFGDEEAKIIAPAIEALQAAGIDAIGPVPGDALFTPRYRERFDVAICMYHDQALIPLKALDFDAGVNVTLGLPIVRTSADHGTAFDIAGKGMADPGATIAAIRMASDMAARRSAHD